MEMIVLVALALFNTGLLILASKWGISEYYQLHRRRWMPEYCEFCTFFWMAAVEVSIAATLMKYPYTLQGVCFVFFTALVMAVISRKFL